MIIQGLCRVINRHKIGDGLFSLTMAAPRIAGMAQAGQFIYISCGQGNLLRRPISICDVQGDRLCVVFQVKGEGTRWLSARRTDDVLDVFGPLGHGYQLSELGDRPVLIGGGIGVPPLLLTMHRTYTQGRHPTAILGFRTQESVILEKEFRAYGQTYITTEDGSYGTEGLVTDILSQCSEHFTSVCACGPRPMLKAVAALAQQAGLPCQVSLEERMGCGIGACLVCVCQLKSKEEPQKMRYGHVCKDGPVFDAKEVHW